MNRRISTLCKYLLVTTIFFAATPVLSAVNDHPAFKFKSNKELANLKPVSKSQTPLSRVDQKPSVDELHYDEKHPHKDATLVDTASIDTSKLIPSKVISLDPNRPDLELPDPQITIAGETYILSVVESILDPKEKVRYVTAKIIGREGRARFIIDDGSGEVVGNLMIEGDIYRVLPREIDKNQQLIYRLKKRKLSGAEVIKPLGVAKKGARSINRLERALLKAELLKEIEPKVLSESSKKTGGRSKIIGGDIGVINAQKIVNDNDISVVEKFLTDIEVLTRSSDEVKYQISKISGSESRGYSVNFKQIINGIPLRNSSRIRFTAEGKITELSNLVINSEMVDIKASKYSAEAVLKIAKKAARRHIRKSNLRFITLERTPINLGYKISDDNHTLVPYWEVLLYEVEVGAGHYRVFVDGNTGRAKVNRAEDYVTTQFQTDVCEHESGISLPACEDVNVVIPLWPPITIISNVRDIIRESPTGQLICEFVGLYQDPQAKHPWEVINNMEDWLSENTNGICCDEVGGLSESIDVKINTTNSGGPSFDIGSSTISFPHPASLDPATLHKYLILAASMVVTRTLIWCT